MKLVVIHSTQLVVSPTLLSMQCAIKRRQTTPPEPEPILPHCVRPCNLALAALPVAQVSIERLFSAIRLLLSDPRSRLKQDAVEAMLLLHTSMI